MKKINRKRLNNKGFTLIELLAVVVILAVVMGIAMTSVLSSMNKARAGSLEDSAMVVANAFTQKYTEALVDGTPNNVFGDILGDRSTETQQDGIYTGGYDFTKTSSYTLDPKLVSVFNINRDDYLFSVGNDENSPDQGWKDMSSALSGDDGNVPNKVPIGSSFVHFDASTGKFTVCLFANSNGSYYVDAFKVSSDNVGTDANGSSLGYAETEIISGLSVGAKVNTMFACSNGVKSW